LPGALESACKNPRTAIAKALPHYPQLAAGIDHGSRRYVGAARGDRFQLAPRAALSGGDGDLPCVVHVDGDGKVKLAVGAGSKRRAEEFSFGDRLPRRSIGLGDYQLFFLPAVTDPRGPGSIRAVESDSRVVVFHAVAGSEARRDGYALHRNAAV